LFDYWEPKISWAVPFSRQPDPRQNPVALGIVNLQTVCEILLKFELRDKRKHEKSSFQAQWPAIQAGCEVSS